MTRTPSFPHPSRADLAALGAAIAAAGFGAHETAVARVIELADNAGLYPGSVAVLTDASATDTLRLRAFDTLARHWGEISESNAQNHKFRAFDRLLAHWNQHQELRSSADDVGALWSSRRKLDELRLAAAREGIAQPAPC